jgi:hypothetical protein
MKKDKKNKLEAKGWKVGTTAELPEILAGSLQD